MLSDIIVWGLIICFALMLAFGIVGDWLLPRNNGTGASLTAFHDFQPKDKQEAIVIVMEQKAAKKHFEQTNGDKALWDGQFEIKTESEMSERKDEL